MRRTVSTRLELEIRESAEIVLQIAVAAGAGVEESLEAVLDGTRVQTHEIGTAQVAAHTASKPVRGRSSCPTKQS